MRLMELNKNFITKHVEVEEYTISPLGYTDDDEMVRFGKCRPSGEFVLRHVIVSLVSTCYSAITQVASVKSTPSSFLTIITKVNDPGKCNQSCYHIDIPPEHVPQGHVNDVGRHLLYTFLAS